ncbi:EAL domain-containing protein [Pseudoduganella aquatica]|uniref:Diguanylate cyclase DosC n=1 Tax=Pseudoduganella aquatica TaxID=2660641 RepID=A0A7X4HCA8_9BURK|nr:EAL domain-containing protein [Pseudoduganella aquatica]MYN08631.1 EAL domain-containing protein [Pseudoduganella aquatica]
MNRTTSEYLAALIEGMMPAPDAVRQRLAFLEFGQEDAALLRQVHDSLQRQAGPVVDAFYRHLRTVPELARMLADEARFARLRHAQADYFSSLTGGAIDDGYVRDRVAVGLVHRHIGLEPQWYIGAYRKYLDAIGGVLREALAGQPELAWQTYEALLKVVCFDLGLALDTYISSGEQELRRLKTYSEQVIDGMPAGVMTVCANGTVRTVNRAWRALLSLDSGSKAGRPYAAYAPLPQLQNCIAAGLINADYQHELVITAGPDDQPLRYLRCKLTRVPLDGERMLLLVLEDVTASLQARAQLRASEARFRSAFGQAAVGLAQLSPDGRWLRANFKLQSLLGYTEAELAGMTLNSVLPPEEHAAETEALQRVLAGDSDSHCRELRYCHKAGHLVWVQATYSRMYTEQDGVTLIGVIEDVAQRKRYEQELTQLARQDALTGLANRALLLDRLTQAVSYARRASRWVAVLFLDLDRFKNINDSLGHDAGDQVLVEVAARLLACVRSGDTVARLGGDEFVVLLADVARGDEVAAVAQKLADALAQPMFVFGHEITPVASFGISLYPKDGGDSQALLKNADAAMYSAKKLGGAQFQFYAQDMNLRTLDRLKLEAALRHAVERDEFELHYQPQLDMASGVIDGVEALVRWRRPGHGLVPPAEFIPVAEETGLIIPLGDWVLRAACAQQAAWRDAGLGDLRMAVNLSARQFKQQDLAQSVVQALHDTGCAAGRLELEITESVLMEHPDAATLVMEQLSDMGVKLSIDDFGSGYSSLAYLKRFPIHSLKIDRSFVHDISCDEDDAAIASAIIALAHSMKLNVIAEGVETGQQLAFLRREGCDHVQGYYFSRPLPAAELALLLARPPGQLP